MGAIVFRRNRILLVERGRNPLKGYWSIPGGVLEAGERLQDAVCREVLEETGLIVRPVRIFEVFERIIPDPQGRPEYHYVLIDYLCRVRSGTLRPGDDVSSAEWVGRETLSRYLITEGTLPVIEKAFSEHRK